MMHCLRATYSSSPIKTTDPANAIFCKGTVLKRMMKCGQKRCACHQNPAKRHGPYFEWTYKANGKTATSGSSQNKPPFIKVQQNNIAG
jgi:hypothetical protein